MDELSPLPLLQWRNRRGGSVEVEVDVEVGGATKCFSLMVLTSVVSSIDNAREIVDALPRYRIFGQELDGEESVDVFSERVAKVRTKKTSQLSLAR